MRRTRVVGALLAAGLVALGVAPPAMSQEASIPSGTWEGHMAVSWTVRFDASAGGGFVSYSGSGPMLFESVAGDLNGEFQYLADGFIIPGPGSPFQERVAFATLGAQGKIRGGLGAVTLKDVYGGLSIAGSRTVDFGPSTGSLTIERVGCVTVSGRMLWPPAGLAAIDAVGTFSDIQSFWSAALTAGVGVEEERRIIENLARDLDALAVRIRVDGGALDRALIIAKVTEAERRLAGLSAEAACGLDWTSLLAGSLVGMLYAAVANPDGIIAHDLEFLVSTAVRAGAIPTATGEIETQVAALLGQKLDIAVGAGDTVSMDAVFMAAVALGDRALAERALAARGGRP